MSKYIDAEKLIAKIDKKWKELADKNVKVGRGKYDIEISTYLSIKNLITSLQQEQQEVNLENEIKGYTEALYHETFGNGQGTLDEFDWEDIVQVIDETAHYFYNLNKNDA